MKRISLLIFIGLVIQGCTTSIQISKRKIHKSSKFDGGFSIYKIIVDSFDAAGKPFKYKTDSVFACIHVWDLEFKEIPRYLKGESKVKYLELFRVYDSLNNFDKPEYRNADTINYYSTRYIPAGVKRSVQFYEIEAKLDFIRHRSIKTKYRKTIYFSKPNNRYRWFSSKEGQPDEKEIAVLKFVPNSWYVLYLDCSYGLLTSGNCTFFFSFNRRSKPKVFRTDEIHDGPF